MLCIDYRVGPSQIPGAGSGLFLTRAVSAGKVLIAPSHINATVPLAAIHFDSVSGEMSNGATGNQNIASTTHADRIRAMGEGPRVMAEVDRIKLVNPDLKTMTKGLDGSIRTKDGQAAPIDANVQLVSGFQEASNVNAVDEMRPKMPASARAMGRGMRDRDSMMSYRVSRRPGRGGAGGPARRTRDGGEGGRHDPGGAVDDRDARRRLPRGTHHAARGVDRGAVAAAAHRAVAHPAADVP